MAGRRHATHTPAWAAAFLIGLGGMAGMAEAAPVTLEDLSISKTTEQVDIQAQYPRTGISAIDEAVAGWAARYAAEFEEQATADFISMAEDGYKPPGPYSLYLNYTAARNDDDMFVVNFDESIYTGGAHPNHYIRTFNFLMPDGWQVFLPEIFEPDALERISQLAIADLQRQWDAGDSLSDDDWLNSGAGPDWANFEDFLLLPDALVLRFPPYQVAAYAAGAQAATIPLSELRDVMRSDWRVPVPSFDCARAGNAAEQAVCADVALARLDRELSEMFDRQVFYADDVGEEELRESQRAWLQTRNQCESSVICLTGAYRSRMAALTGP